MAAESAVERFSRNFPELFELACLAALPVALDAKLLHLIRLNSLSRLSFDDLPFDAESVLLLSPLCVEISDGLYEIPPEVRKLLLRRLTTEQVQDVSRLLWACSRSGAWSENEDLDRAQWLTALNYLMPPGAHKWLGDAEQQQRGEAESDGGHEWIIAMKEELSWLSKIPQRGKNLAQEDIPRDTVTVYLSYSWNDDKPFVERLQTDLTAAGFTIWRDETHLDSRGEDLADRLRQAIDVASHFVPIVGPQALASRAVQAEWAYARETCKSITPVWRLGDAPPEDYGRVLYFDFRESQPGYDYNAMLRKLIDRLRRPETHPGPIFGNCPQLPVGAIPRKEMAALAELLRPDATVMTSLDLAAAAVIPALGERGKTTLAAAVAKAHLLSQGAAGTLHAPGGLGKTILAAMFVRDCATRRAFSDGLVWLTVGKNPDVAALQGEAGRWLGDDPQEYRDATMGKTRLRALLARRRVLIVLDDVWDARHAEAFLVDAPDCRWLITTRKPGLAGQLGLGTGNSLSLDYLSEDEGAALIARRLGGDWTEEEWTIYRELARELGGHTLAINNAAGRLDRASDHYLLPTDLLRQLRAQRDSPDPFANLELDTADRERNLELSLGESYATLDDVDRRRFRALGAFAPEGTFGAEMAAAIWDDNSDDAANALNRLARAALLSYTGSGRYSQHSVLRGYALALLQREGELDEVQARHFAAYATEYKDNERNFAYAAVGRHDQITADFANISHALEWGLNHMPETACDLLAALENSYMQFRLPAASRLEYLEKAREAAGKADYQQGEARTLRAIGDVQFFRKELDAAFASYEAALALFRAVGDRLGDANTLKAIGDVQNFRRELDAALASYEAALALFRALGDRLGEANTLRAIGDVQIFRADHDAALASYEPALTLFRAVGDRFGEANALKSVGDVQIFRADHDAALSSYHAALDLFRTVGARLGEANTLKAIGDVQNSRADHGAALANYEAALALFRQTGDRFGEANTLKAVGDVQIVHNDREAALKSYQAALALFRQTGARLGEASALTALGSVYFQMGEYKTAWERYEMALPIYAAIGDRLGETSTIQALENLQQRLDNTDRADPANGGVTAMFSYGLRQAAEKYLDPADESNRARSEEKLIQAGTRAIEPLIDALIHRLRKAKDIPGSADLVDALINQGLLNDQYADMLRNQVKDEPGGMSYAMFDVAMEATRRAWAIVLRTGEQGIRELFKLINGSDRLVRLAAFLVLNMNNQPNRFVLNLLYGSVPFTETRSPQMGEAPVVAAMDYLIVRLLHLSGDSRAQEIVRSVTTEMGVPVEMIVEEAVLNAIQVIVFSR